MGQTAVLIGQINLDINVLGFQDEMVLAKESAVEDIGLQTGGDAQNVATVLAQLGREAILLGRVGKDAAGDLCLARTGAAGVDCSHIQAVPNGRTGTCVDLVRGDEAAFLYHPGENIRLCLEDIPLSVLHSAQVVGLHSLFAMPALDAPQLLRLAKEAGACTFADTTNIHQKDNINSLRPILPLLDVFSPSYSEAAILLNRKNPAEMALKLLEFGVKTAVIKLGDEGCVLACAEGVYQVPGFTSTAVDTTGAGDNFCAGFLYGLLQGYPLPVCARYACAAGAVAVGALGATGARQSAEKLRQMVQGAPRLCTI